MSTFEKYFSQMFKNKKGEVVIAQKPNAPIYIALIFYLIRFLPISGITKISFLGLGISMLYWSYLEITSGVNLFRRLLGVIVGSYFIYSLLF